MGSLTQRFRIPRRRRPTDCAADVHTAHVRDDLLDELPDEDLGEDLRESLDLYEMGSKPRCEEAEYLETVEDAIERIARGG